MKRSTLVACLIVYILLEIKGSDGTCAGVPGLQARSNVYAGNANVDQQLVSPGCGSSTVASLLAALCSTSTLDALSPTALVSIVNTLSATPRLFDALQPTTLVALLRALSSSPAALKELSPVALLVLLAAVSSTAPTAFSSIPQSVLTPLLETLSASGLLPPAGRQPATIYTQLPPLPAPSAQVIAPGPATGPILINLPKKNLKPPPIIIPSGPPPTIVVSIPQPYPAPPPLILPTNKPGPILINEDATCDPPSPIVVPAPEPPNIFFTTHLSKSCPQNCDQPGWPTGCKQPSLEMPIVYSLPPGVSPEQYFQNRKISYS